jgi:hypothetical protein
MMAGLRSQHFLRALLTIGALALGRTALADPIGPEPLFVHNEILNVPAEKCHDSVKNALAVDHVGPGAQDFNGFQFGVNSTVSIAAWCLRHFQNPGDTWLVIAITSNNSGAAENARDDFVSQVTSWLKANQ